MQIGMDEKLGGTFPDLPDPWQMDLDGESRPWGF